MKKYVDKKCSCYPLRPCSCHNPYFGLSCTCSRPGMKNGGGITFTPVKFDSQLSNVILEVLRSEDISKSTKERITKEYLLPKSKIINLA